MQSPDFSQSYNRYSYVWNNPLKYTDPDGEWVMIAVFALYSAWNMGLKAGIAAERSGGHFWRDGFWKGAIAGAFIGSAGYIAGGAAVNFFNIGGIFSGAAIGSLTGAAVGGIGGGLSSWAMGGDFWDGAKHGALIGGISGAFSGGFAGYGIAKERGLNYWWGTKAENWGQNRNQWSFAWWNKPDVVEFDYKRASGFGQDCMVRQARELERWKGGKRSRNTFIKKLGTDLDDGTKIGFENYSKVFQDLGFTNSYAARSDIYNYNKMLELSRNESLLSAIYPSGDIYHTTLIKKIKYYPNGKVIVVPGNGSSFNLHNWHRKYGANLRFFIFN